EGPYAAAMWGTDHGTAYVLKLPSADLDGLPKRVPVAVRHELWNPPTAPVIRTVMEIHDQPDSALVMEVFTNPAEQDQRHDFVGLSTHEQTLLMFVSVQPPGCGAGSRDGNGLLRRTASLAATRKSSRRLPCCRQVATTVSSRSAKRLPASLSDPKLPLRHSTAGRTARSAPLFVGSTPSTRAKVHSAAHHFLISRQSAAALWSEFSSPRRSSRPIRAWSGINCRCNPGRSNSPVRKPCHSANSRPISASP